MVRKEGLAVSPYGRLVLDKTIYQRYKQLDPETRKILGYKNCLYCNMWTPKRATFR